MEPLSYTFQLLRNFNVKIINESGEIVKVSHDYYIIYTQKNIYYNKIKTTRYVIKYEKLRRETRMMIRGTKRNLEIYFANKTKSNTKKFTPTYVIKIQSHHNKYWSTLPRKW